MIIHEPVIHNQNGEVILSAKVESAKPQPDWPETLWFSYPEEYAPYVLARGDAFLSSLILVAAVTGEDIECHGEVSPRLLYNLNEYCMIFNRWDASAFRVVQIRAPRLSPAPAPIKTNCYAGAFSGGVDSFFTLQQGLPDACPDPGWRLSHGLFILGAVDIPLKHAQKYDLLLQGYRQMYSDLGFDLISARTNLMQFSANRVAFRFFLEAPLIGCALGLGGLLSGLHIPSGRQYTNYRLDSTGPITAHLLATESFEAYDAGSAFTRQQKIAAIADWAPAQRHLRVCVSLEHSEKMGNCSRCEKCLRTRMDLHVLNRLDKFQTLKNTFDLMDYVRWGRWMQVGYGWEWNVFNNARQNCPRVLPGIMLGIVIGYVRATLRRILPRRIQQYIFKFTSEGNPHQLFEGELSEEKTRGDHF